MPKASVIMAAAANPGLCFRRRKARRESSNRESITGFRVAQRERRELARRGKGEDGWVWAVMGRGRSGCGQRQCRWGRDPSGDEGIDDADAFEAGEVAVGGPKLADGVLAADGVDSSIVHGAAGDAAGADNGLQLLPIAGRCAEQVDGRGLEPGFEGVNGNRDGSGRTEDFPMRGDGQKLVDAGPWDGPGRAAFGEAG